MASEVLPNGPRRTKPRTTPATQAATTADHVQCQPALENHEVDAVWCGDHSYVPTRDGSSHPVTAIDLASRPAADLAMADHLYVALANGAPRMALA